MVLVDCFRVMVLIGGLRWVTSMIFVSREGYMNCIRRMFFMSTMG